MKIIGITGGVGAGKTTVLNILKEICKCKIVMADDVAKGLMVKGGTLSEDAVRLFGKEAYLDNGMLNTVHIASLMYGDDGLKEEWTALVHPAVKKAVIAEIDSAKDSGEFDFFFLEAALLLEDNYDLICDEVWYVDVSEEERIRRLAFGRGYSEEKSRSIMSKQLTKEEFLRRTDFVIDNGISEENTRTQLENKVEEYWFL